MRNKNIHTAIVGVSAAMTRGVFLTLVLVLLAGSAASTEEVDGKISYDGLKLVASSKAAKAFIDPDADFSVYKRVKILKTYVAFKRNWQRDQNRQGAGRITASDMERIKADVGNLFLEVFAEKLSADGGFKIVDETGDDVLLLRPAIIDLDIAAPDTMSAGRSTVLTTTAGAATIYIKLFDSVSGRIIGRATDRQAIRDAGNSISWTNRAMNAAEARRVFGKWADQLRKFLDQHYTK